MAQPRLFFKIFILCLLNNAIGGKSEKTELGGQPKNILVFLVAGMSPDVITNVQSDLAKESSGGAPSNVSHEIPFENMPIHGTISQKNRENPGYGLDTDALKIMFNKPYLEDTIKTGPTSRHSSNLMYLAHQVEKKIGFITTVNATLEIPSAILFTLLESSYPSALNSSVANNEPVSTNESLAQVPFLSQRFQTLENLKSSNFLNITSSIWGLREGSDAASKEKTELEDKILTVDIKDLRKVISAVLQSLKKNINGFFLVVSVDGGNPVVNVQTVSHFMEDFLSSDLSQETLVIVTPIEESAIFCTSVSTNDGQKKVHNDNRTSSAIKRKQSNAVNHQAKTVLPQKNILESNANSPKMILLKTTDEPWENSAVKEVSTTVVVVKMHGEGSTSLATMEGSTPSVPGLLGSAVTTERSTVTNESWTSSSTENSKPPSAQKYSTSKNNRKAKGNFYEKKHEQPRPGLGTTEFMSTNNGNDFVSPTATEATLPSHDMQVSIVNSQVPPVPEREDRQSGSVVGLSEFSQTKPSDVTFSSSLTMKTEDFFPPAEEPVNNNQVTSPSIEEKLSTSESMHTHEGSVNFSRTGNENFKERSRRDTESESSLLGIPLYAAGPGSSSFQRTLSPHDLYLILQRYIVSASTSVENSEIKGNSREMNESRKMLSADDIKTNSASNLRETKYLCLIIAILNIIMWF